MLKNLLTRKELAEKLNVNISTINRWQRKGLPYVQLVTSRKLYDFEAVEKWLLGEK